MCFNNNNKKIVFLINKLEMADKNKIKVAVRVRPFSRRGIFFPFFNFFDFLIQYVLGVSLETKTRSTKNGQIEKLFCFRKVNI